MKKIGKSLLSVTLVLAYLMSTMNVYANTSGYLSIGDGVKQVAFYDDEEEEDDYYDDDEEDSNTEDSVDNNDSDDRYEENDEEEEKQENYVQDQNNNSSSIDPEDMVLPLPDVIVRIIGSKTRADARVIKELDFSDYDLTSLQSLDWLQYFPNLETLNFNRAKIKILDKMPKLKQVKSLSISRLNLSKKELKSITSQLPNLKELYLEEKSARNLPNLPKLTTIDLSYSKITIKDLQVLCKKTHNLRVLDLSHTNLKDLSGFPVWHHLDDLDLSYTNIRSFYGMPVLSTVRFLSVEGTKIKMLRSFPRHFPAVSGFIASNGDKLAGGLLAINFISVNAAYGMGYSGSRDPDENATKMRVFSNKIPENIRFCTTYRAPKGAFYLSDLKKIEKNDISTMDWMEHYKNLKKLVLHKVELDGKSKLFQGLTKLETIKIWGGRINNFNEFAKTMPKLQELQIHETKISDFSGLPKSLPRLETLDLEKSILENDFKGFPKNLPRLKDFFALYADVKTMKGLPKSLPRLERFLFSRSKLVALDGMPQKMPKVEQISLELTELESLKGFPKSTPNLKYLNLKRTYIYNFVGLPKKLPKLEALSLALTIPHNLEGIPKELPNLHTVFIGESTVRNLKGIKIPSGCQFYDYVDLENELISPNDA